MKQKFGVLLLFTFAALSALAHGGGLDRNGCHTNRSTGEYHCHGGRTAASPTPANVSQQGVATAGPAMKTIAWSEKVLASDEELVKTAQYLLRALGSDVRVTGTQDAPTTEAITAFQSSAGMLRTGRVSGALLQKLADPHAPCSRRPLQSTSQRRSGAPPLLAILITA